MCAHYADRKRTKYIFIQYELEKYFYSIYELVRKDKRKILICVSKIRINE